jgi:hypothetical protein
MMYSSFHTTHSHSEHDLDTNATHSTALPQRSIASQLTTREQMRDFELLRLARFVLKLHKLEQAGPTIATNEGYQERAFQHRLLHHVIFQQVLALTALDARHEALRLIAARQYL